MRLYDEIFRRLGKDADAFAGARYTVLPGRGGYFQGVKTIGKFSDEYLLLGFSRLLLEVEGKGFVVRKYCDGDLELSGNILSVRVATEGRGEGGREKNGKDHP